MLLAVQLRDPSRFAASHAGRHLARTSLIAGGLVELVADRFAVNERGHTIDLATGARVTLTITHAGGRSEELAWAERCAWLSALVHPSFAELLDYGGIGDTRRIEAWGATDGWPGCSHAAEQTVIRADRTLRAFNRSALVPHDARLGSRAGGPVVIPDHGAGRLLEQGEPREDDSRDVLALVREPDRRLGPLLELLASPVGEGRPTAISVWMPEGAGVGAVVRALARSARIAGYVPVLDGLLDARVRSLVKGRSLAIFSVHDPELGWRTLIDASLDSARPHLLIFVGAQAIRRVHTIGLERVALDTLKARAVPDTAARRHTRHVVAAARRSRGLEARFEQLFFAMEHRGWPEDDRMASAPRRVSTQVHPTAAERLAPAQVDVSTDGVRGAPPSARMWPSPGEINRLRRQACTARDLLVAGRQHSGERLARQVSHALARRGEWAAAAESGLLLATTLLRRGRVDDAARQIELSRPWVTQSLDVGLLQDAADIHARVLIEQGHLTEAELTIEGAVASAVSSESGRTVPLTMTLVRCLRLLGRWSDGWQRLSYVRVAAEETPERQIRFLLARSRVALGLDRISDAVADAARARDTADTLPDEAVKAHAHYGSALALMVAGDTTQAEAAARRAAECARHANDLVLTMRVRLLRAEIARRTGQRQPAAVLVRRLGGRHAANLPFTIRARVDLLRDLLAARDPTDAVSRRIDAAGLPALRLFAPTSPSPHTSTADAIVDLMRCCQTSEEDTEVLRGLCAQLRPRLGASGVGFFARAADDVSGLVVEGRVDSASARRVASTNQLVLPHNGGERVEAGVPVRYGGRVVGVLVTAWLPTAAWNASDVALLLPTAAAAAGPALSAVVGRRLQEQHSRVSDLLGVSRAIADVRAAIDRAASAPFPALVEGESGSGKELVARSLHRTGVRRDRPYSSLNCAALPDDLVESELFGHARGAFTGAIGERRGVFEEAHTGTLFLDEVGELSLRAQAKLLRAVQEGEIRRVGENVSRRVDVRLITATNRDLRADVDAGRFRADLLYRLDVIRIALPPLRDRIDDIPILAEHFWRGAAERIGSRATLAASTLAALSRYHWPGNVRELQNVLAALAVRCPRRGVVPPTALPPHFTQQAPGRAFTLESARRSFDRAFVRAALARAGGQRTRAAGELGLSRQGLAKLMVRLSIQDEPRPRGADLSASMAG